MLTSIRFFKILSLVMWGLGAALICGFFFELFISFNNQEYRRYHFLIFLILFTVALGLLFNKHGLSLERESDKSLAVKKSFSQFWMILGGSIGLSSLIDALIVSGGESLVDLDNVLLLIWVPVGVIFFIIGLVMYSNQKR